MNAVDIQNATLAGGVIVGATSDLMLQPVGAFVAGCLSGIVSTCGYQIVQVPTIVIYVLSPADTISSVTALAAGHTEPPRQLRSQQSPRNARHPRRTSLCSYLCSCQ